MTRQGIKLTLPSGEEFEGTGNLSVQPEQNYNFLAEGGGALVGFSKGIANALGGGDVIGTPLASIYAGEGGTRVFEIAFDEWEGNTNNWGPLSNPGQESVLTKLTVLERELAATTISSQSPATFEFGEFASSGVYDPINVVIAQATPSVDFGEQSSIFRTRITVAEAIDTSGVIDGFDNIIPEFKLSPLSGGVDDLPIPGDTLAAGTEAAGRQSQGRDVAEARLVDSNQVSDASPATSQTRVRAAETRLRGAFRGANSGKLANRLREDYLANSDVTGVELTASDRTTDEEPMLGSYSLGPGSAIDPIVPQESNGIYGFELDLRRQ